MPVVELEGLEIAYELVGEGQPWVLTPGGRFTKEVGGLAERARALADHGRTVLTWDRPNCGASSVVCAGRWPLPVPQLVDWADRTIGPPCLRSVEELTMTPITVQPIRDDLSFGARVGGLTREDVDDQDVRDQLAATFEQRGLLIFEDVDPTPEMQVAISTVFGPLEDHPSSATPRAGDGMLGVIGMRHEPNEVGVVEVDGRRLSPWLPWHFDHCYNDQLNRAAAEGLSYAPPVRSRWLWGQLRADRWSAIHCHTPRG